MRKSEATATLDLATTTSVRDSGLLEALLPGFQKEDLHRRLILEKSLKQGVLCGKACQHDSGAQVFRLASDERNARIAQPQQGRIEQNRQDDAVDNDIALTQGRAQLPRIKCPYLSDTISQLRPP